MAENSCEYCGTLMGIAEKLCHDCGREVSTQRLLEIHLLKAENAWISGAISEALNHLEPCLEVKELGGVEKAALLQKKGSWLQRRAGGNPMARDWVAAEAAFREAIVLNDANEVVHQLWIANLSESGRVKDAIAWYDQRIAFNSADEIALKFKPVAKLMLDFKSENLAKDYSKAAEVPATFFQRMFYPSPANMWGALVCSIGSAILAVIFFLRSKSDTSGLGDPDPDVVDSLVVSFADPGIWVVFSCFFASLYGFFWWMRR